MLRPLCSNEVPVLARTLIKISKNLNSQYALPKTAFTVRVSWVDIFDMSFTERTKLLPSFTVWHILSLKYIQGLCTVIKLVVGDLIGGCRFNLRFFGDYYFLLHLICCYMALMLLQHLWGVLFFFVYTFLFFAITVVYFVL